MAVFQLSLPPALAEGAAGTEENRKIQDGLTLGNGQTTAKYWDFVRDYLNRQKKNYDLT